MPQQKHTNIVVLHSSTQIDQPLHDRLIAHLRVMQREGLIKQWSDQQILPGSDRSQTIDQAIRSADLIFLLISVDFLASDASYQCEMQQALERQQAGVTRIVPIIVRPCDWQHSLFGSLQTLPRNGKPVSTWNDQDAAFLSIIQDLRLLIAPPDLTPAPLETPLLSREYGTPGKSAPPFVFVSYAHEDAAIVNQLKADLLAQGIEVWIDKEGLRPGIRDWEEELRQAIKRSTAILLAASPAARSSPYVKDELRIADMYQRTIYPFWIAGEQWMESIPIGMGGTQYIDARQGNYAQAVWDVVKLLQTLLRPVQTLVPVHPPPPGHQPRNPYKGLHAFGLADAADFFGRDHFVAELVKTLGELHAADEQETASERFLAVIGASGSGKSSVVMAGVFPQLQAGALPNSQNWLYLTMLPGSHPVEMLIQVLLQQFPAKSEQSIREMLMHDNARGLHILITLLLEEPYKHVILFIDQFEELFTQTSAEDERRKFLSLLTTACTEPHGPLSILLTLRADFYDRPLQYPEIGQLIEHHHLTIFPMELRDFRNAIEKPAQLPDVQLTFEDDLVGDLLFDTYGQSGALPLLQFTLEQLVRQTTGHVLTLQTYQAIGGVRGVLKYLNVDDWFYQITIERVNSV